MYSTAERQDKLCMHLHCELGVDGFPGVMPGSQTGVTASDLPVADVPGRKILPSIPIDLLPSIDLLSAVTGR